MILGLVLLVAVMGRSVVGWYLETHTHRGGVALADEAHDWLKKTDTSSSD